MEIVQRYKKLPPKEIVDWETQGIKDVLELMNINIDAKLLFLLGQGIGFEFEKDHMKKNVLLNIWSVCGKRKEFFLTLLDALKATYRKLLINDEEELIRVIKEEVGNNKVLFTQIPLDTILYSDLSTQTFEIHSTSEAQLYNIITVPIIGMDESEGILFLGFDPNIYEYTNSRVYPISIENFMIQRQLGCKLHPLNPEYYVIDQIGIQDVKRKVIYEKLKMIVDDMLYSEEEGRGIRGILYLSEQLDMIIEQINKHLEMEELGNRLFVARMKNLTRTMEKGSYSFYRGEFSDILTMIGKEEKNQDLQSLGETFKEIGVEWKQLIRMLYIVEHQKKAKYKFVKKLCNGLNEIANKEKAAFKRLEDIIKDE